MQFLYIRTIVFWPTLFLVICQGAVIQAAEIQTGLRNVDQQSYVPIHVKTSLTREQAAEQALSQNPTFLALQREIDIAYARREQADGFESPSLFWNFEEANRSYASGIGNQVFGIKQSWEWFGVRNARKELTDLGIEAAQALVQRGRLRLTARVHKAYDYVLLTEATQDLLERLVTLNNEAVDISRTRFKAGDGQYIDLMRTRMRRNQLQNELLETQTTATGKRRELNRLLGRENKKIQLTDKLSYDPFFQQDTTWLQQLKEQGPTFVLLDRRSRQAEKNLSMIRNKRYPEVTLAIGAQRLNDGTQRENALAGHLSFKLPLPGSDRQSGLEAEALAQRYAVTDQAQAQLLEVHSQFNQTLKMAHTLDKQLRDYQSLMLPDAEDQLKAAQHAYRVASIDALNLLDVYATYSEIQQTYLETLVRYRAVVTDLQTLGEALWEVEL